MRMDENNVTNININAMTNVLTQNIYLVVLWFMSLMICEKATSWIVNSSEIFVICSTYCFLISLFRVGLVGHWASLISVPRLCSDWMSVSARLQEIMASFINSK